MPGCAGEIGSKSSARWGWKPEWQGHGAAPTTIKGEAPTEVCMGTAFGTLRKGRSFSRGLSTRAYHEGRKRSPHYRAFKCRRFISGVIDRRAALYEGRYNPVCSVGCIMGRRTERSVS
jgi:hypothetical protein